MKMATTSAVQPQSVASFVAPQVYPFLAADYVVLHAAIAAAGGKRLVSDPRAAGEAYEKHGPAFTAWFHGEPLAAAGLCLSTPGWSRATAWVILSPRLRRLPRAALWFVEEVRTRLDALMVEHNLLRVEADVREGHATGGAFVAALGFTLEATSPCWGPKGETFLRYVKMRRP